MQKSLILFRQRIIPAGFPIEKLNFSPKINFTRLRSVSKWYNSGRIYEKILEYIQIYQPSIAITIWSSSRPFTGPQLLILTKFSHYFCHYVAIAPYACIGNSMKSVPVRDPSRKNSIYLRIYQASLIITICGSSRHFIGPQLLILPKFLPCFCHYVAIAL